jgi:4-oxalomesaconate hydratase
MALQARVLAQAIGVSNSDGSYPTKHEIIGAPPVFFFEPHQPEQSDFKPNVLLDITAAFPLKQQAMQCLPAQKHMWEYYTSLAIRRGAQVKRNAGPNLGLPVDTMGEAYMRYYPQVTDVLE